jgi:hypothetical protein
MTRKHFIRLAQIVAENTTPDGLIAADLLAVELANLCAEGNPRFDPQRFLEACADAR